MIGVFLKILVVTQYFWPENFRINDLVRGLKDRGHEVTVFTGLPNYPQGEFYAGYSFWKGPWNEDYQGVKVIRSPLIPRGKKKGIKLAFNFLSFALFSSVLSIFLVKGRFDRIFVYEVSPVTVGIPGIVLKYLKKIPLYFWVTDIWPESLESTGIIKSSRVLGWVARLVQWIYYHSDKILVSSPAFIQKVKEQKVDESKIIYFPQWAESCFLKLDFEDHELPENEMPKGFKVMFAGNIGTSQSFETLVEAAIILKGHKDIKWVVLGDGLMKEWVQKEIVKQGLQETFFLLGSKTLESMPRYYALADALVISLKKDPLFSMTIPSKVQSCLASGKPIIAAIDGEGARIIQEAQAGMICPASDPQKLSDAILNLYSMKEDERQEMGDRARKYYLDTFEREMLFNQLESIMEISS